MIRAILNNHKPPVHPTSERTLTEIVRTILTKNDCLSYRIENAVKPYGLPDLYCVCERYGAFWIELKLKANPINALSASQREVIATLLDKGVVVHVVGYSRRSGIVVPLISADEIRCG